MCNFVAVIYGRLWYPIVCILAELMVLSVFLYWCLLAEMKVLSAFLNRDCTIFKHCAQVHTLKDIVHTLGHTLKNIVHTLGHTLKRLH